MTAPALVDHFFRHEYGRLVAMLSCRIGVEHIEDVEDAVQSALISALEHWTIAGLPNNPPAWLFRAAHNNLMGELRPTIAAAPHPSSECDGGFGDREGSRSLLGGRGAGRSAANAVRLL